jgi:TolA-binding protein
MATYQQVVDKYPKSYAAPFAGYAQAEILLRDFRRDEAKVVLDSLVSQFPDSTVARLASAQLSRIGSKAPR